MSLFFKKCFFYTMNLRGGEWAPAAQAKAFALLGANSGIYLGYGVLTWVIYTA